MQHITAQLRTRVVDVGVEGRVSEQVVVPKAWDKHRGSVQERILSLQNTTPIDVATSYTQPPITVCDDL